MWKDYVPSAPLVPIKNKEFTGKVSGRKISIGLRQFVSRLDNHNRVYRNENIWRI